MRRLTLILLLTTSLIAQAQLDWGDQGNGTYKNPILNADYSDPDVIRVGEKYYMVASDFHWMGMQVLESDDLVNWRLLSQVYRRLGSSHTLSRRALLDLCLHPRRGSSYDDCL